MACSNEKYNPNEYGKVSLWVKTRRDWQSRIQDWYRPEDAKALIDAINDGTFGPDFGRVNVKDTLIKRDPLTNARDVTQLKAHYVNLNFGKMGGDFDRMVNKFKRDLIERVLIDSNYKRIEVDKKLDDGITVLNHNLYNYKIDLLKALRQVLFPSEALDYTFVDDRTFSLLLSTTLAEYESRRLTDNKLDGLWDTYFTLKFFDQLISDFKGFVKIKPEYEDSSLKGLDMYDAVQPYVAYDTSFNPEEFASADQYASEVLKTLLEYFKEMETSGKEGTDAIGFKGFNYSVTRLIEWVEHQPNSILKQELDKGNNINWSLLIDAYIKSNPYNKEIIKKLRGLKAVFNTGTLDSTIREMLNEQRERVVRYQFEQYRMMYDPGLHRNVLVPSRIEDTVTDRQKGSIARTIRTRVNRFRKNPSEYQDYLAQHGISYDRKAQTFTFKGFLKSGGDLVVNVVEHPEKTYIFKTGNYNGGDINDGLVKSLVESLLNYQISEDYESILRDPTFAAKNLWDTWGTSIMRTLAASLTGNDAYNYTFRNNGIELEFRGTSYTDFNIPAMFLNVMNGISKITMTKNGLGNDLPIYQQISAIHKSNSLLRAGLSNLERIRSSMHDNLATRFTIFDNNILKPNQNGLTPIGSIFVRSDFDHEGTNKNSAQMNFAELSYLSIMKSYYHNLFHNSGKVLLQTTCLSDKHTHFMVEFLTDYIRLANGMTLHNALIDSASLNDVSRNAASLAILNEIKTRRDQKTRVQITNLINRYSAALGLAADAKIDMSYEELKRRIDLLHNIFNGKAADGNNIIKKRSKDELNLLCRDAFDGAGVDYFSEADLIEYAGNIYFNETLYHNFLTYCDPNPDKFNERMETQRVLHAKLMFQNHFVLDANLDPDVTRAMNSFRSQNAAEAVKWIDAAANTMKVFRIFNKNTGEEIFPNYISATFDAQFDPEKVRVVLNPILNSHFLADVLLSNSFNDIVFGDDYGVDAKFLKKANKAYKKQSKKLIDYNQALEAAKNELLAATSVEEKRTVQGKINLITKNINDTEDAIKQMDYNSDLFRTRMEASRLNMHYKRTVHGGATYTPLLQGLKWGVGAKVKVAAYQDTNDPMFSITGDMDKYTSQDGAGWSSPYFSRMANRSYVDGAVGPNKKTIFSYVDPETGVLTLIKWAEYEITNAVRRDSPADSEHASSEIMFRKMHNERLDDAIDWDSFDISKYYNRKQGVPGITRMKPLYRRVIDANSSANGQLEIGKHYMLTRISNEGHVVRAIWQEVDEHGFASGGAIPIDTYVNSIYDLDQVFGGAFVEEVNNNGWLDWSEAQNDIVYTIICDNDLKENFKGFAINTSAIKSGMRNVNNSKVFFRDYNRDKEGNIIDPRGDDLLYFEISTRTGGAQMNADHIISEAEVTEMSQMISALIQAGLKTNTVNNVYKFIGKVAAESLGNVSAWIDDPGKEDEVYKWIGEAVSRSFQTGQGDTLGLAGAFIGRANKNLQENGLKTKIPFSANTVKGVFEASITSLINNKAIHRKYPGGGFVQNPTFDVKPRYNFGGISYSYTEFAEKINEYNQENGTNISVEDALNNSNMIVNEGVVSFENPFIRILNLEEVSSLDIDDTVVVWDPADPINTKRIVRLRTFSDWDQIRNFSNGLQIAKWDCRPKNLLGSRTFFNIGNQRFSLYDLDSVRVSLYVTQLLNGDKVSELAKRFVIDYANEHPEILAEWTKTSKEPFDFTNEKVLSLIKQRAVAQTKEDLRELSKIQQNGRGQFKAQKAFKTDKPVEISNINTAASQILIGVADAKAFGIERTADLESIRKNGAGFFRSRMNYLTQKPSSVSIDSNVYDIVAKNNNGRDTLVIIRELHDTEPSLEGMVINTDYHVGADGNLYKNDSDLGIAHGKTFYKYVGKDGVEYDVLYCDTLADFNTFNKENDLYSNTIDNYNVNNYRIFSKTRNGRVSFSLRDLNDKETERQKLRLDQLAKQKYESWKAYVRGVATRIPSQSMQSFTAVEVIGFTNDDITNAYVSTMLAFLQGSDFDIDKLYVMRYGFTEDGKLATYSDLDKIFSPEKCLDLPVPQNRHYSVSFSDMNPGNALYFDSGKGGIDLLRRILEVEVEDPSQIINIVINRQLLTEESWGQDFYEGNQLNPEEIGNSIQNWLNTHERTRRSGSVKEAALRNVVVRGILNVITDASTQFNLQIPISMDEQRAAADNSTMSADEQVLTADCPSAKVLMQGQNMVGRDVIGIGAASLKGYFAASTYFNTNAAAIASLLKRKNNSLPSQEIDSAIFSHIIANVFNGKFYKKGLITLGNVNYKDAIEQLGMVETIHLTAEDLAKITEVNNKILAYIENSNLNIRKLLIDLDAAANGSWSSPIDSSFSLSGLISAATDNAKELILAKINATSKFADIYTYLLSIGESFETIADFMMTPEFKVVADYAEGNMMDQSTRWFDLEHSLNFVLDEETLPNVENRVFMGLLTNNSANWNFLTQLLYGEGKATIRRAFIEEVAQNNNLTTDWVGIQTYINNILSEQKLKRGDEYTPEYKRLVKFIYNVLRNDLSADELLLNLLRQKVESTRVVRVDSNDDPDSAMYEQDFDEDYYQDSQEDFDSKPAAKWFNAETLKHADWVNLYRYVAMYLLPKNQALQGVGTLTNLNTLKDKILPALKEQRILAKILGVNQGINTKDFDEYKWIRDIEAFVNERFINSTTIDDVEGFDLIRFLMDENYKQKMISDYEKVKSTYNVLAIVNSADQFKAMLEMAGRNRRLIEKAYIIKVERKLANALLESNKKKVHNLSIGLTQKLYEKEFQVLKNFTEYLIMANWVGSLGDLQLNIPYNWRSPKKYFSHGSAIDFVPGDILDGLSLAEIKNFIEENNLPIMTNETTMLPVLRETVRDYILRNNIVSVKYNGENMPFANQIKTITLNDMDGMATFKWLMEHHIIERLKEHENFKNNPFIKALQLSSKIDPVTEREIEFYSLDIDLGNVKDNSAIENLYNLYLSGFNQIWNEKLPKEIGVTSDETGDWTIGDLFYLYNLYVNRDGFGRNSLTRIFDNVVLSDDDNTLLYRYYDYICRLDSGLETIEDLENLDIRLHGDGTPNLLTEARIALATQPNSSRKFRSEFVPKTETDEARYSLLSENYDIQSQPKVNNLDKNYYLFPFVTIYNPIKILETSEHAKLMNRRKIADFKVGGKEAIETVVKAMQSSFGETIPIIAIDNTWFDKEGRNVKNKDITKTAAGFIYNGKIYINTDNAQVETPIHELMHVVCAALKFGTPEQRNLYYRLLKEINDLGRPKDGEIKNIYWNKVINEISSRYAGIAVGSDLQEEVLVNSLAALFGSGYIHAFGAENPDSIVNTSYQEFQDMVYKAIGEVFKVKLPEAAKSDSMKKLMNMPLAQLLLDFSSSLFNFNGNTLTRVYIPISQKLAEFKTKAVKNSEDTGAQLIFSGDC